MSEFIDRIKQLKVLDKERIEELNVIFSFFNSEHEKDFHSLFRNIFPDFTERCSFVNFLINIKREDRLFNRIINKMVKPKRKVFVITGLEGTGKTLLVDLCLEALFDLNVSSYLTVPDSNKRREVLKKLNLIVVDEVNDIEKINHVINYNINSNIIVLTNTICSKNHFKDPDTTIITTNFNRIHGDINRKILLINFKEFFSLAD